VDLSFTWAPLTCNATDITFQCTTYSSICGRFDDSEYGKLRGIDLWVETQGIIPIMSENACVKQSLTTPQPDCYSKIILVGIQISFSFFLKAIFIKLVSTKPQTFRLLYYSLRFYSMLFGYQSLADGWIRTCSNRGRSFNFFTRASGLKLSGSLQKIDSSIPNNCTQSSTQL
jgi:hypothetical protein